MSTIDLAREHAVHTEWQKEGPAPGQSFEEWVHFGPAAHTSSIQEKPKGGMLVDECGLELVTDKSAVKFDNGKLDWSLMPWDSVEEILKVLEFGKIKYSAWNWSSGEGFKYSRVFNSLIRHLFAWFRGEDIDPESGLSHLSHAGCNILFLIYFVKHKNKYKNNDDRV